MAQRQLDRRALLKLAAAVATAVPGARYSVVRGDTLSSIAARNGTTWRELARLNDLKNPDRLSIGQRLRLPERPAPVPPTTPAAPVLPTTAESRINHVASRLHSKLNNPDLEAAILANFNRETGGRFDHATKQIGGGGGYGIPQYTGASLAAYRKWLAESKLTDSADSQVDYFVDKYMPSRFGYKTYMAPGAKYTKEQYADWLHRRVFTPAHTIRGNKAYSEAAINKATQSHSDFMKNRLRAVNGVWQAVKAAEGDKARSRSAEEYVSGRGRVMAYTPDKTKGHDQIVIRLKDGRRVVISNNTALGVRVEPARGDEVGYHGYRVKGTNVVHKVHMNMRQPSGWLEHVKSASAKAGIELREGPYKDVKKVYDALTPEEKNFVTPGRTFYKDVPYTARRVAYDGGVPIGFADLYGLYEDGSPRSSQNLTLAVSDAARGRRVARSMVDEAIEAAVARARRKKDRRTEVKRIIWSLLRENEASARAAANSGFTERVYDKPHGYRRFVKDLTAEKAKAQGGAKANNVV